MDQSILVKPDAILLLYITQLLTWLLIGLAALGLPFSSGGMIVFLVATAAMCWLSYYLMLVYASSCASLQSQLEQFTFGKLDCACCAKGHASEDEHCDRKTISQCISVWFGSTEQFERAARQEVQHALQQQLGKALCPYSLHLQLEVLLREEWGGGGGGGWGAENDNGSRV